VNIIVIIYYIISSRRCVVKSDSGFSALHCAIDAHDRVTHDSKIDSRRTIFQLINRGANITVPVCNHY